MVYLRVETSPISYQITTSCCCSLSQAPEPTHTEHYTINNQTPAQVSVPEGACRSRRVQIQMVPCGPRGAC